MREENQTTRPQLSGNHRRVLSIRLRLLEESCFRLLDLFHGVDSIFTLRQALPKEREEMVETGVQELRSLMAHIKSHLGLECSMEDASREAAALMAAMTTSIEELHPHYLKGYGEVPEPTSRYLETRLEDLMQALRRIEQALGKLPVKGKAEE